VVDEEAVDEGVDDEAEDGKAGEYVTNDDETFEHAA
jgi:hypothetical protein